MCRCRSRVSGSGPATGWWPTKTVWWCSLRRRARPPDHGRSRALARRLAGSRSCQRIQPLCDRQAQLEQRQRRSMPPSTTDTIACSRTAGLAWKAMLRPASPSIGRSLAPSPTAIACAGEMPSLLADLEQHAALFSAVDDIAPWLVDHAAGQLAVADLQHIRARKVDAEPLPNALAEEGETARGEQGLQPGRLAGRDEGLDTGIEPQPLCRRSSSSALAGMPSSSLTRRRRLSL